MMSEPATVWGGILSPVVPDWGKTCTPLCEHHPHHVSSTQEKPSAKRVKPIEILKGETLTTVLLLSTVVSC